VCEAFLRGQSLDVYRQVANSQLKAAWHVEIYSMIGRPATTEDRADLPVTYYGVFYSKLLKKIQSEMLGCLVAVVLISAIRVCRRDQSRCRKSRLIKTDCSFCMSFWRNFFK